MLYLQTVPIKHKIFRWGSFNGYYTDGTRDGQGHLVAHGWNSNAIALSAAPRLAASNSTANEVSAWPGVKMDYDSTTGYYVTEIP